MTHPTCCICSPEIPMNPHLCPEHKAEAREYAEKYNTYFSQAAGELYLEAKTEKKEYPCVGCGTNTTEWVEWGMGPICPACDLKLRTQRVSNWDHSRLTSAS